MSTSSLPAEIVKTTDLCKNFDDLVALSGVDLTVERGMIHALVGPDGAGKTTLIRILAGIMSPSGGGVSILGRDIVKNPESAKDKIGYLSQRFSLNPVLTVKENIDFFASLYKVPRSDRGPRLERLLEFSRLGPFKDRQAARLSGGMKQKLSLCCALIHTPELLLLDEPTTGVDPISRRELWEILYDLLSEGVTIIISTPYMDEAERAGMITLLHKGKTVVDGDMAYLKSQFKYTLYEVIGADNRLIMQTAAEKLGINRVVLFGDRLHIAFSEDDNPVEFKSYLENSGLKLESFRPISPGLEDIFIQEISGD